MQKSTFVNTALVSTLLAWLALCTVVSIAACTPFNNGRTVYDRDGLRIGIDIDPSIRRTIQSDLNNHPIDLDPKELESLLQVIHVSGFSGTLFEMLTKPQPIPVFTPQELSTISEHLTMAFREAKPTERVSFSLPKPDVAYSEDRTAGFLFFRGRYLHVVLTDHSSFIRTDTGGGDYKDIRDTKGMKLWVAGPAQAAPVRFLEEPRWAPFERVHISLTVKEVLAQKENIPAVRTNQGGMRIPVSPPATVAPESRRQNASPEDLQLQIQELSNTNQDLRGRLDEQNKRTQQLQDQVEQLRRELLPSKPKGKSFKSVPEQ